MIPCHSYVSELGALAWSLASLILWFLGLMDPKCLYSMTILNDLGEFRIKISGMILENVECRLKTSFIQNRHPVNLAEKACADFWMSICEKLCWKISVKSGSHSSGLFNLILNISCSRHDNQIVLGYIGICARCSAVVQSLGRDKFIHLNDDHVCVCCYPVL